MSKSLAASKRLMQTYLSELLTEETNDKVAVQVKEKQAQPIEQLLNQVSLPAVATNQRDTVSSHKTNAREISKTQIVNKKSKANVSSEPVIDSITDKVVDRVAGAAKEKNIDKIDREEITTRKSAGAFEVLPQKDYRKGDFQAMFFDVAGLTVAVPLIELGGIHNSDKTTALMGKPKWFKGVMLRRDEKINVVDTALWVMPEKCDEKLLSALDYQYIIMLNDSNWGLTAENLVDTVTLKQEDVKWLDSSNKRPWLAGLVKDRMCALLDVDSLIKLLEKGVNITQE
ncbi:chemotaxis protein CheW [Cognaticolwellia mytili]|uniref:chemotaxis protein CheW n=1 Tax=Cognaticolwellia mytili TaxID=1888913 RepID=UPI000A174F7D|nr:chemotaxis protein CheW [Cognaticolwellia mytili]